MYCPICKMIVKHHIQETDENGSRKFIEYSAECNICEHVEEWSEELLDE